MASTYIALPEIDHNRYKYYYVLQEESNYAITLFESKPVPFVDPWGYICFFTKEENDIPYISYFYSDQDQEWQEPLEASWRIEYYDFFKERLINHNFMIDLGDVVFGENPLSAEGIEVPEPEIPERKIPDFPALPSKGVSVYKHYFVTEDDTYDNHYHLYLFKYEPAKLTLNEADLLIAVDEFGNSVECHHYVYINYEFATQPEPWELNNYFTYPFSLQSTKDPLISYNNFEFELDQNVYAVNLLPNNPMLPPDLSEILPKVPNIDALQYKRYYIARNEYSFADQFELYLFETSPEFIYESSYFDDSIRDSDRNAPCRIYKFYAGQDHDWQFYQEVKQHSKTFKVFRETLLYHNFTIDLEIARFEKNPLPNDQLDPPDLTSVLPGIPSPNSIYNKSYYIVRDKQHEEKYHLYLYYEEMKSFQVDEQGYYIGTTKSGYEASCYHYTNMYGQKEWKYVTTHREPFFLFSEFADTLLFHSFSIGTGNTIYAANPLPGHEKKWYDPVPDFPEIPDDYGSAWTYKHYYIARDKNQPSEFHLYLFETEPTGLRIDENGSIIAATKYGTQIPCTRYTYQSRYQEWGSSEYYKEPFHLFMDFADTLLFNNFDLHLGSRLYEKNPFPNDRMMVPDFSLLLPKIPNVGEYNYKHYCIRRGVGWNRYHLYLFKHEPVSMKLVADEWYSDDQYRIELFNQYGNQIKMLEYEYDLDGGGNNWIATDDERWAWFFEDSFADTLVYHNVTMKIGEQTYECNPMRDDGVTPAVLHLPHIPYRDDYRYKHYYVTQDSGAMDQFCLYLLHYEPESVGIDNRNGMRILNKYGSEIYADIYRYTVDKGEQNWIYEQTAKSFYSFSQIKLMFHNFVIKFEDNTYEEKPIPNDGLLPALEPVFPQIPFEHPVHYKYYFIVQDQFNLEQYKLYLMKYEPASIQVNDDGNIVVLQKYGRELECVSYAFTAGSDSWRFRYAGTHYLSYNNLDKALIYHNFDMISSDYRLQANPMPNDGVIPALAPDFPPVPNEGKQLYKHYYITQNKSKLDQYHVFVMEYEPVIGTETKYGTLDLLQKYGTYVHDKQYCYTIGEDAWSHDGTFIGYRDVLDAVVYNNFPMNLDDVYYGVTELPNDGIIPAPELDFPDIPLIAPVGEENTFLHYMLVQNPQRLELYLLYLLKTQPSSAYLQEDNIVFLDENGAVVENRQFNYSTEVEEWKSTNYYRYSIPLDQLSHYIDYCSFDVLVPESQSRSRSVQYTIEASKNTMKGGNRKGWTRINGKWYYYVNGKKSQGVEGWVELDGKTFYLDGADNYARVQNRFITIRASKYYFNDQGVMVSGSGILINGKIYNFSVYGVLLSEGLENAKYEIYTVIDAEIKVYEHDWSGGGENPLTIGSEVKVLLPLIQRQSAFDGEFYLSCLYEGSAHWITENALEKKAIEGSGDELVTLSDLITLGWPASTDKHGFNIDTSYINELNTALNKYDITDPRAIELFLANVMQETGRGFLRYEVYSGGGSYSVKYRGAGAMQITDEEPYKAYATYLILEQYPDLIDLVYDGEKIKYAAPRYPGASDISKIYKGILAFANEKGYNISKYTDIVDKGAEYVGDNYHWDSGAYDFAIAKRLSSKHYLTEEFYSKNDRDKLDFTVDKINKNDAHRENRHTYYKEIIDATLFR